MVQRKRILLGTRRLRVRSLASLSGLPIRHCCELWYRSQMWLRSSVAVAVVSASSCSSNSTPSLGTSICCECSCKKTKDQKKKKKKKELNSAQSLRKLVLLFPPLRIQPRQHVDFSLVRPSPETQWSCPQTYWQIINVRCFRLLRLWSFVAQS